MSEYGEYKMKSAIVDDPEAKAKQLLDAIIKSNILDFHIVDESIVTGTTNFAIAGDSPGFNSAEEFYVYDIGANEWIKLRYDSISQMEYISSAD